jgi:hypothetical protein
LQINLEPLTGATGKSPVTITITPDHTGPLLMAVVHAPVAKPDMPSQYPILEDMFNGIASDPLRPKKVDEVSNCERRATPRSSPGRPTTAVEQPQSLESQVDKAQFWQLLIDGSSSCPPGFVPGP